MTEPAPKVRHVDLHPDEFIAAIAGDMDQAELGTYWMICLLIYSKGGPIPADVHKLASLHRNTHWRTIRATVDRLVERGFIDLIPAGENGVKEASWVVQRCVKELSRAAQRIVKNRSNGRQGGRPSKENNQLPKPNGSDDRKLTTNYQLPTTNLSEDEGSSESEARAADAPGGVAAEGSGRRNPGDHLDEAPLAGPDPQQPTLAGLDAPQVGDEPQSRKPRSGVKTRWTGPVPSDWQNEAAAQHHGLNVSTVAMAFEDYWTDRAGTAGLKSDWHRTWQVWVARDAERSKSRHNHGGGPARRGWEVAPEHERRAGILEGARRAASPGILGD